MYNTVQYNTHIQTYENPSQRKRLHKQKGRKIKRRKNETIEDKIKNKSIKYNKFKKI